MVLIMLEEFTSLKIIHKHSIVVELYFVNS